MLLFLASCGGAGSEDKNVGSTGGLKATILNSKTFNPNISHGKIAQYKVTVEGDSIIEPITAVFDGNVENGIIEGVPVGSGRIVKVEAINLNDKTIRAGEAENVEISSDNVTEVEINLESVPIFANLIDGNSIPNTQLIAKVFSDPNESLEIKDENESLKQSFNVLTDISTGLASASAKFLLPGKHTMTVRNLNTGRFSTVTINLIDGTKVKPAPFFSAGNFQPAKLGGL